MIFSPNSNYTRLSTSTGASNPETQMPIVRAMAGSYDHTGPEPVQKPLAKWFGRCESEFVVIAKQLRRRSPKGDQLSLRAISAELASQGYLNEHDQPFAAASVKAMLEG